MRRGLGLVLGLLLLAPTPAHAVARTVSAILQNAVSATGNGTNLTTTGLAVAVYSVSGTFTGTVTFEGTVDGTNYQSLGCVPVSSSGAIVSSTTTTGSWRCNITGFQLIRGRVTWTSGTSVTVAATASDTGLVDSSSSTLTLPLTAGNGGTGFGSYVIGDLLMANTTATLARLADVAVDHVLVSGGVGVVPAWSGYQLGNGASAPSTPASGASWWLHPTQNVLLGYDGTGWQSDAALSTKVINTADPRWGCKFDQVTDDAACINAAIAAAPTLVGPGDMGTRGGAIVLVPKQALIKSTINLPGQNTALTITLQCSGLYTSGFIWGGGNNADMVTINRSDNANTATQVVRGCGFYNHSSSGTGITAVRATNINGIRLGSRTVATSGQNDILIELNGFFYLDNAIIAEQATAPVNITVRNNLASLLYNQTSPVVNPATDAVVTGHGNFLFFDSATIPQNIFVYDNDTTQQNWMVDVQSTSLTQPVIVRNFEQSPAVFTNPGGVRLAGVGPGTVIHGNDLQCRNGTFCLDLGTTALETGSGADVRGNIFSGLNTSGTGVRVTFGNAVVIEGNAFFNMATAINLVGANVTAPTIGKNDYTTVTTKLTDGGAVNRTILDQQIGIEFPAAVTLKTALTVPNGGTGAATFTAHGLLLGEGTSALGVTAAGASGAFLLGRGASADPSFATTLSLNEATTTATLTSAASQNSILILDGSTSNGFGAHVKYKTKTGGGVAQEVDVGTGITSSSVYNIYDGTNAASLLAATIGGGICIGGTCTDQGANTLNVQGAYYQAGTIGVTCAGINAATFTSKLGIVTHC